MNKDYIYTFVFIFKDGGHVESEGRTMIEAFESVAPLYKMDELFSWKLKED